jgi:hypothetical protein
LASNYIAGSVTRLVMASEVFDESEGNWFQGWWGQEMKNPHLPFFGGWG